jgi:hypothetical protein
MPRVLIIAENSLQQERLCNAIKFDRSVQLMTANIRQINPKNLKAFKQSDLIILEDTSEQGDPRTTEFLLSSLKTTGLPIVLLPSMEAMEARFSSDREPLVLNLTEESIARPGLAALINKIRIQYTSQAQPSVTKEFTDSIIVEQGHLSSATVGTEQLPSLSLLSDSAEQLSNAAEPSGKSEPGGKMLFALTRVGRIAKQLREPLSNMNLAIHMLSQVRSIEERDRYVKLLREEYQRELQLVNELEHLHESIQSQL